jgi:hypothetical protein
MGGGGFSKPKGPALPPPPPPPVESTAPIAESQQNTEGREAKSLEAQRRKPRRRTLSLVGLDSGVRRPTILGG